MTLRTPHLPTRTAIFVIASIILSCAIIGGLQPAMETIFGEGTLFAMKAGAQEETPGEAPAPSDSETPKGDAAPEPEQSSPSIFRDDPLASLALALQQKQTDLKEREKRIREEEARLAALRASIEEKLERLQSLREEIDRVKAEIETQVSSQRKKEIRKWVEILESMDPAGAAGKMEALETDVALEVLSEMDSRKVGKILQAMQEERAVALVEAGLEPPLP